MGTRRTNQSRLLSYSVDLFQGGVDSDASPYMLPPGMAAVGENIEFYRDNTLRVRRGLTRLTPVSKTGMTLTHRLQGEVRTVLRQGTALSTVSGGVVTPAGTLPDEGHLFLRALDSVVVV